MTPIGFALGANTVGVVGVVACVVFAVALTAFICVEKAVQVHSPVAYTLTALPFATCTARLCGPHSLFPPRSPIRMERWSYRC